MAIVRMKKFTLLAFESKKNELLGKLQDFANAEFINLQDEDVIEQNDVLKDLAKDAADSDLAEWEEELSKVKFALQFLEKYVPKPPMLKALKTGKEELSSEELAQKVENGSWQEVYNEIKEKDESLLKFDSDITKYESIISTLEPYKEFDAPLEELSKLKKVQCFLGSVSNQYEESINVDLEKCYVEIISKDNHDLFFFAMCPKDDAQESEDILRTMGYTPLKIDEDKKPQEVMDSCVEQIGLIKSEKELIKKELSTYDEQLETLKYAYEYYQNLVDRKTVSVNFLKTDKTTVIQGWIPEKLEKSFESIVGNVLGQNYYLSLDDVKEDEIDDVPIALENIDLNAAFEDVTTMYALPKYNEVDPTPVVTPFYMIFFGMMVADMGYGLLMLIGTIIATTCFKFDKGMKRMVKFFHYLSYPTIAFGAVYGSFFGDFLEVKFGIHLPRLLDTNNDVMTILVLSVVFGAIQIFFALGMKAYILCKLHKPMDALMDAGSWVLMLVSLGLLAAGFMMEGQTTIKNIGIAGSILGAIAIVFTQGRMMESTGGKIGQGLYELYGITSYVGDLVSYTRLMAIGLSGGSIAGAVNMIMNMIPGPLGTFLFGPLIFIMFQTVNLLLSLLSGYVHTLRLTYVEYFGKFYDGGGRAFKPFETKNKYINLKNEK